MLRSTGFEGHFGFTTPCVSFSLRGVGRALLIRVGKRWCSSRGYRSRLRSCVHFLPGYLVGWSCHNSGRCFGPTIRIGLPVLIPTRYWRLLLATILSYLGTTDQNAAVELRSEERRVGKECRSR